jgi:hypothetical protein
MKKLFNILILCLIYLVFCGKSCVDDSGRLAGQEKQVSTAKNSIRDEFESGYLSEDARNAAEVKAMQQLRDLADYIEMYSDVTTDSLFRVKAGEMIREMFVSEDSKLSFGQVKNKKMKSVALQEFLQEGFGDKIKKAEVIFDSIRVLEPLKKSGEEVYSGELVAFQTVSSSEPGNSNSIANPVTIHFVSVKRSKIIGKDTLKVWQVLFKDMEVSK